MRITICNPKQRYTRTETFLDGRYDVVSRSGVNPTEALLVDALPNLRNPESLLLLGNRTGVSGLIARDLYPDATVTCQCLDAYYAGRIAANLRAHSYRPPTVRCAPAIAEAANLSAVLIQATPGGLTGELLADLLEEAHDALRQGGACVVALEGKLAWVERHMTRLFGSCSRIGRAGDCWCAKAIKRDNDSKHGGHRAEFVMTMQDAEPVRLVTIPGVFSHRRVDAGAQALAEVVKVQPGDSVLDMGCGCGVIGITIAHNHEIDHIVFVDANARAIQVAEENCRLNGITNYEVLLSASGIDRPGEFSLFVGNPPYFTDYKIAELFVRTAYRCLRPGGRAYVVAKNARWHVEFMGKLFGNVHEHRRRGYGVVESTSMGQVKGTR